MHIQSRKLTKEQVKQLIIDYNNGDGPGNLELAKKYNISNTHIRYILMKEKVYKQQRGVVTIGRIPDPWEIKTIRDQNRLMRATLKGIAKFDLPEHLKNLLHTTLDKVTKNNQ